MPQVPTMLTIEKTAQILHVSENFVRNKVKDGSFVAVKAGNKTLVNLEKAIEFLNTNKIN